MLGLLYPIFYIILYVLLYPIFYILSILFGFGNLKPNREANVYVFPNDEFILTAPGIHQKPTPLKEKRRGRNHKPHQLKRSYQFPVASYQLRNLFNWPLETGNWKLLKVKSGGQGIHRFLVRLVRL